MAKHIHSTLAKSSTVITNLVGPMQQMSLADHPVKGLYFTLAGGPEVFWFCLLFSSSSLHLENKDESIGFCLISQLDSPLVVEVMYTLCVIKDSSEEFIYPNKKKEHIFE